LREDRDWYDVPRRRRRRPSDDDQLPSDHRRFADKRRALATRRHATADSPDASGHAGARWSTWDEAVHGPEPRPDWVVTELAAVDTELGLLKTGKEADVHLVQRAVPGTERSSLLAAKRYRASEHRLFHRDAGYLEGRRVRKSRELRAMTNRTGFGREVLSAQWAVAEFEALSKLWVLGVPVPYPVQLRGTELLLEFVGDAEQGAAAPRLAQLRPSEEQLRGLWQQLLDALVPMAGAGLTHGDLSPYNVLVHDGRLVLIDLPQVVDVVANPQGVRYLRRDVAGMAKWFAARGLPADMADADRVVQLLLDEAGMG
jgi:RIO kinase 1